MATQVEPAKNPAANKYDKVIRKQLEQTSGRVRRLDWLNTTLVVATAGLAYAVLMLSLDLSMGLPTPVRLASFAVFGVVILGYLALQLRHLVFQRVNPYYAARQLEKTVGGAKHSLVNWLDLHEEPLPAAIRNSLSIKAAHDADHADPDRAIRATTPYWFLAAAGVLFAALLIVFASAPGQFASLLKRSFLPFEDIALVPKTALTLLEPKGGNATIGERQAVVFRVRVEGRVPKVNQHDSLKLLFRYTKSDVYKDRALEPEQDGDWHTTLAGDQIPSPGVYYKIVGGDTETPEYFLHVTSAPLVTNFNIVYKPRPYRPRAEKTHNGLGGFLEEYEGTKVQLKLTMNRELQSGYLLFTFDDHDTLKLEGTLSPNEPNTLAFEFPLTKTGTYLVHFKSKQGEENSDPQPQDVRVFKDPAPTVQLLEPAQETIQLPANGILKLKGEAKDANVQHLPPSAGLKRVAVQMKVVKGHPAMLLQPTVYREGKSLELVNKHFPNFLEYQDFVELDKLKAANGAPFQTKEGMEIEYWLEAVDVCDYPAGAGQLAKSAVRKLIIQGAEDQKKADEQKAQAEKEKKNHDKKQDQAQSAQKQAIKSAAAKEDGSNPNKGADSLESLKNALDKQAQEHPGKAKAQDAGSDAKTPQPMNQPPETKPSGDKKGDGAKSDKDKSKGQGKPPDAAKKPDASKGSGDKDQPQPSAKGGDQKDGSQATGDKSGQKQPPMADPDSKPGGAKKNDADGNAPDAAKPKGMGEKTEPDMAQAKGDPNAGKPPQGSDTSPMPPKTANADKGTAKPGPGSPPKTGEAPRPKQLTPEQIQDLSKKLKDAGLDSKLQDDIREAVKKDYKNVPPDLKNKAEQELKDIGKKATNPETKKAAQDALEALKETGTTEENGAGKNGSGTPPQTGDPGSKDKGNSTSGDPNPNSEPKIDKASGPATPTGDPNNKGSFAGTSKPDKANAEFLNYLSTLQLEQLKDKIGQYKKLLADKAMQNKLKLTPQQIEDAKNYLQNLEDKVNNNEPLLPPGSVAGVLGSTGVTQLGPTPGQNPQAGIATALPPPEYQQAFKKLTTEPAPQK